MQTLNNGDILQDGKYRIQKVLGQGGFGITYLATHELLGTKVAIKEFFFKQYCNRDEKTSQVIIETSHNIDEVKRFEEKFLKEARIIAKLNHPNIIKIHDVFKENNTAYYVMDYIEGQNLSEKVKKEGSLKENLAISFVKQAGAALAYVHKQRLNHLDVKPANLMLCDNDNTILLIDFGLSKQYDAVSGNQTSSTPVGISHGYAPIEQYKEGGVSEFSPQTDIYSLGATLLFLLTGKTPPQAGDILNDGIPDFPPYISSSTQNAIINAMEVRKNKRPGSIDEFLSLLSDNDKSGNRTEETVYIHDTDDNKNIPSNHNTKKNNKYFIIAVIAAIICSVIYFIKSNSSPVKTVTKTTLVSEFDSLAYSYGVLFGNQYSNFKDEGTVVPGVAMNVEDFLAGFIPAIKLESSKLPMNPEQAEKYVKEFTDLIKKQTDNNDSYKADIKDFPGYSFEELATAYGIRFGTQYSNFQDEGAVVPGKTMNLTLFLEGFTNAIRERTDLLRISPDQAEAYIQDYQNILKERIEQKRISELQKNKEAGSDYLKKNSRKEGVMTLASGLQIETIKEGTGKKPKEGGVVVVNYVGKLIDGTIFDSNDNVEFNVNNVIKGFKEGLLNMKVGGKAILTMSSDLAYGDKGAGDNIPGGSALIFEIELLSAE